MLNWTLVKSEKAESLIIIDGEGHSYAIPHTHPYFYTVKEMMLGGNPNEDVIKRMIDPSLIFGDRLQYRDETFFLDGKEISLEKLKIRIAFERMDLDNRED